MASTTNDNVISTYKRWCGLDGWASVFQTEEAGSLPVTRSPRKNNEKVPVLL